MSGLVAPGPGVGDGAVGLEFGPYRISVATSFGPRVVGLRLGDGPEMLARLSPEVVIDRPDSGIYRFHGGHRLWAAPEVPAVTYAPDDHRCDVVSGSDEVSITGPVDRAGLAKTIVVRLRDGRLVVDHILANDGPATWEVAPWAITQLGLGGTVLMPTGRPAPQGLQATHSLVLWPYTDLSDPRLTWLERALAIDAVAGSQFKVGAGPAPGRLGYLLEGHLFTKDIPPGGAGDYPDRGAVAQVYLNDSFCELESVGPVANLAPGSEVSHREVWAVETCDRLDDAYRRVVG